MSVRELITELLNEASDLDEPIGLCFKDGFIYDIDGIFERFTDATDNEDKHVLMMTIDTFDRNNTFDPYDC